MHVIDVKMAIFYSFPAKNSQKNLAIFPQRGSCRTTLTNSPLYYHKQANAKEAL